MAGRGLLPRRSYVGWGVRVALALVAAILGYQAIMRGLALAAQRTDVHRAHLLAPGNGQITAALAAAKFAADQSPSAQPQIRSLAQQALRQDPTAIKAIVTLGFQAQLRNDSVGARNIFDYAQKLTRRDLQVQLWIIEDAVARDDVPGALHQYDIALRTSKLAPDLLFPVLAGAIVTPEVRRGLVSVLTEYPSWTFDFVEYVANAGVDPKSVATFFIDLRRGGVEVPAEATRAAITRLVQTGSPMMAWRYYAAVRPSADRHRSRDPLFAARLDVPTLFDWVVADEAGMSVSIEAGEKGGFVNFNAPPSVGGDVVRQMQLLPPGRYRIEGRTRDIEQPAQSAPYWTLSCWRGRELGQVALPASAATNGRFNGLFTVPVDCPVQMLTLVVRASDAITGVSGQIVEAQLVPAP